MATASRGARISTKATPADGERQLRHRPDGFTLADLVAYNDKHNEANGEDGRDGSDDTRGTSGSRDRRMIPRSSRCGVASNATS
ncbi:MAG: hypothetical protein R2710_25535 [Acidimicrobiales bacterium]